MWVRGLKQFTSDNYNKSVKSHPMWVRGLKQKPSYRTSVKSYVAPYVGAWIETIRIGVNKEVRYVAPYVGAWIETNANLNKFDVARRRTLCGCVD